MVEVCGGSPHLGHQHTCLSSQGSAEGANYLPRQNFKQTSLPISKGKDK